MKFNWTIFLNILLGLFGNIFCVFLLFVVGGGDDSVVESQCESASWVAHLLE